MGPTALSPRLEVELAARETDDHGAQGGADALIGQPVGPFVVEAVVSAGQAYTAAHPTTLRRVALQLIQVESLESLEGLKVLAGLHHPRLAEIIGIESLPDGRKAKLTELVVGESLDTVLHRDGPMSVATALPLIQELLSGLSAAHRAGVVHHGLSSKSVVLAKDSSGEACLKVVDFTIEPLAPDLDAAVLDDLAKVGELLSAVMSNRTAGTPDALDTLITVLSEKRPSTQLSTAAGVRQKLALILRELAAPVRTPSPAPRRITVSPSVPAGSSDVTHVPMPSLDVTVASRGVVEKATVKIPEDLIADEPAAAIEPLARFTRPRWQTGLAVGLPLIVAAGVWLVLQPSNPPAAIEQPEAVDSAPTVVAALPPEPRAPAALVPVAEPKPAEEEARPIVATPTPTPTPTPAPATPPPPARDVKPAAPAAVQAAVATRPRVARVSEAARRWLQMSKGCDPNQAWRSEAMMTLRELGEVAAKSTQKWQAYSAREPALSKAIVAANAPPACGRTSLELGNLVETILSP